MAGYKKISKEDAEVFIKLYRKYLLSKVDELKGSLETLPTDVIERCFNGAEFFDKDFDVSKIDEAEFGVGGLHGWLKVRDVARSLEYCTDLMNQELLVERMSSVGHKVNLKKVGVL
ncbi:hypothetical protein SDC9_85964 [bioreactor metagenome]|uniref:Uncharacterized protein n=1 Tax=bioreactor metagenome TaxID=1076179 RepID=A0A644ZHP0_9ZZZZ